jgi:hypothetical protein
MQIQFKDFGAKAFRKHLDFETIKKIKRENLLDFEVNFDRFDLPNTVSNAIFNSVERLHEQVCFEKFEKVI